MDMYTLDNIDTEYVQMQLSTHSSRIVDHIVSTGVTMSDAIKNYMRAHAKKHLFATAKMA